MIYRYLNILASGCLLLVYMHSALFSIKEKPLSSVMLSNKKSDPGSSSSSGGNGGDRAPETLAAPQAGPAGPSGPISADVKKKERASPSGEPGGPPLPHPPGPGGIDQDSAEGRRTSRRKRAKVNISNKFSCSLQERTGTIVVGLFS